jgi:hypothetical protein
MTMQNTMKIETPKSKFKSMKVDKDAIDLNYDIENAEDQQLQTILIFCENIHSYSIDKDLEDLIGYYFYFTDEKIKYLEDIQKSFGLANNTKRLTDIAKYLDAFTIGETQHTPMNDFSLKISSLLDLLYSVKIILSEFYTLKFVNNEHLEPNNLTAV